jgi:hypothetical protein
VHGLRKAYGTAHVWPTLPTRYSVRRAAYAAPTYGLHLVHGPGPLPCVLPGPLPCAPCERACARPRLRLSLCSYARIRVRTRVRTRLCAQCSRVCARLCDSFPLSPQRRVALHLALPGSFYASSRSLITATYTHVGFLPHESWVLVLSGAGAWYGKAPLGTLGIGSCRRARSIVSLFLCCWVVQVQLALASHGQRPPISIFRKSS